MNSAFRPTGTGRPDDPYPETRAPASLLLETIIKDLVRHRVLPWHRRPSSAGLREAVSAAYRTRIARRLPNCRLGNLTWSPPRWPGGQFTTDQRPVS